MMIFEKSQLMRGTLEGCILRIINEKTTYGYEIMLSLREKGFSDVSEGTIYPLLLRLEKQGSISSRLLPSPLGPKRKYYTITEDGRHYLKSFEKCWKDVSEAVIKVFGNVGKAEEENG